MASKTSSKDVSILLMYTDQVKRQLHSFGGFTKTTGVRYNIRAGM